MPSALPVVLDALLARAVAVTSCRVTDGWDLSEQADDVLMIGVDDPTNPDNPVAASADQAMAVLGTTRPRDEDGRINCLAVASVGDDDQKSARDAAYSYIAAIEDDLRSDPTLGLTQFRNIVVQMAGSDRLIQSKSGGAAAVVIFTITYNARI